MGEGGHGTFKKAAFLESLLSGGTPNDILIVLIGFPEPEIVVLKGKNNVGVRICAHRQSGQYQKNAQNPLVLSIPAPPPQGSEGSRDFAIWGA